VSPSAVSVEANDIGTCQRTRSCASALVVPAISARAPTAATLPMNRFLDSFI
jgi:hypothetical protein